MNFLYPRFPIRALPRMLGWGLWGALIAGAYGIVHDQVTYSLGVEYFTHFKFHQFHYADPGGHPRLFVAIIGFLATWWVGLIGGWLLARCAVTREGTLPPARDMLRYFVIMLAVAAIFGVGGYAFGVIRTAEGVPEIWEYWEDTFELTDTASFARVGYVHNASYLGGVAGLIVSCVWARREKGGRA